MNSLPETTFRFADFEIDMSKRLLLRAGQQIALNSKTFDLLETLIERRGEIVSKEELLDRIWEGQFVEESNLAVQVSTLRKLLGEKLGENRFIVTVPGKGYKFVGEPPDETDEITIENHRISRIVISEESGEPDTQNSHFKISRRQMLYVCLLVVGLAGVLGCGYYVLRNRINAGGALFTQTQIRQLTNNGKVQIAALSPDGKIFAYVTDESGQQSLSVGHVDGGNDAVLCPATELIYHALAFSPDSNSLFFSMRNEANPDGVLFRIPAFGGVQEKIRDQVGDFALSPDGKLIAFVHRNENDKRDHVFISDLTGAERELISMPVTRLLNPSSLSISPDGQTLAFGASDNDTYVREELFTVGLSNGELKQVTDQGFNDINNTVWLADGSGLIIEAPDGKDKSGVPQYKVWHFDLASGTAGLITTDLSSYAGGLGQSKGVLLTVEHRQLNNIWIAPADDLKQAKQITFGSFGKYEGLWGLDWTPDGRIVFDSSDPQSQVISVMNSDGTGKKQLTAPGQVDSCLSVSNDGRYVVFHSTRGGGGDIWRLEIENGDLRQLTFGKQNYQPAISADSRFVYYKSWEKGLGELRRVSIDGGESLTLTNKETSYISVSPDGKYLAAGYKTDKARLAILSTDGGEPVKQFDIPKTAIFYVGIRWMPDSSTVIYRDAEYSYWQQPIKGGPPTRIADLPKELLYNFAWSKDGKQFAFVRGEEISDVVLFRDVK